jgi:hypothetical protein
MKTFSAPAAFNFRRPNPEGPVMVYNENSYLMGEYNARTGKTTWHRVVLATQRDQVERWLVEHYPAPRTFAASR